MSDVTTKTFAPHARGAMGRISLANDEQLILRRTPNGGWTVAIGERERIRFRTIGAFTDTADMLDALANGLATGVHK